MIRLFFLLLTVGVLGTTDPLSASETSQARYGEALGLIHAYSGSGGELDQAITIAQELSESDPGSGFAQVLAAESLSTWHLGQNGEPAEVREQIVVLADEALRLNPKLAQAHVAKARAYTRASMLSEANAEVDAALSLSPQLDGAMFVRAEIYRKSGDSVNGEEWYRRFIDATPSSARKSNGFYWLGKMFQDAASRYPAQGGSLNQKAKKAYERMIELDPNGAWKTVNFAIFLNDQVADFDEAERYALKALTVMEFPMARHHLAAARYQRLHSKGSGLDAKALQSAVAKIERSSQVSLDDAIAFSSFSDVVRARLVDLRNRMQVPQK